MQTQDTGTGAVTSRWSWAIWGLLAWHLATCAAWSRGLSGLALAMTTLGAIALAALAVTMHRRLDRGLARLSTFFARTDGGETDLSRELPEETAALSPALVEGYRQFVGNLRRSTDETRTLNIRIAQDAAYVKLRVGETAKTADRQGGEIVTEMAMPIHVSGRLWGNVRVGLAVKVPDE